MCTASGKVLLPYPRFACLPACLPGCLAAWLPGCLAAWLSARLGARLVACWLAVRPAGLTTCLPFLLPLPSSPSSNIILSLTKEAQLAG